jgi:hypothetical protein
MLSAGLSVPRGSILPVAAKMRLLAHVILALANCKEWDMAPKFTALYKHPCSSLTRVVTRWAMVLDCSHHQDSIQYVIKPALETDLRIVQYSRGC